MGDNRYMSKRKKAKKKATNASRPTPLAKYHQNKKMLTPPLANLPNVVLQSWINDRLPDMLWAILIREGHPGELGYEIFRQLLRWLDKHSGEGEINGVTHTSIAQMPDKLRLEFIAEIVSLAGTDVLKPLLLLPDLPAYSDWRDAFKEVKSVPESDWDSLGAAVEKVLWHQSQEATDVRWVKLMGMIIHGKMSFVSSMMDGLDELNGYPNKGDQRRVRPRIRSMEMTSTMMTEKTEWPDKFWDFVYSETVCLPEVSWEEEDIKNRYEDTVNDKKYYEQPLAAIRQALMDHFMATSRSTKIDARHEAVFGLALYALDTYISNSILETSSTISGRATARIILETYVTLAHLLNKEANGEDAWDAYRDYGNGQLNLINRKYVDEAYESSMVDPEKMDRLANEDKWSEYVPINLGHWDETDMRKISVSLGVKDLYDKFYPYTSGYLHANWGAVREASFQKCYNPLHRLHRVPSYGLAILPGVNEDCIELLNRILRLVDGAYPDFKHEITKRPKSQAEKEVDKRDERQV